ncbi:nucleotidyltransferase domain-containing protein [Patescibacteria group bacterium]|nr:nucleotidyltransferase domain-containing protein [Candidatus Micrarchaeota archaeon]MBU1757814.1 nucleotidyltransferase domain-containing protein [Patescibacteria group bacterium]
MKTNKEIIAIKKKDILTISEIKKKAVPLLKKNGVVKAGIFGSYARGEAKKRSDIDMLIKVKGRKFSLLDHVRLERELQNNLKKKVDILTYKSVNPLLKEYIFKDEVKIL